MKELNIASISACFRCESEFDIYAQCESRALSNCMHSSQVAVWLKVQKRC